jgi:hypothetical protein
VAPRPLRRLAPRPVGADDALAQVLPRHEQRRLRPMVDADAARLLPLALLLQRQPPVAVDG